MNQPIRTLVLVGISVFASQAAQEVPENALTGVVVSSSANTLVVKNAQNEQFQLYVFNRDTVKPNKLAVGSTVRVTSVAASEPGMRIATEIVVTQPAPIATTGQPTPPPPVVPAEIRHLETAIERQARRLQVGVRGGVGLDPEIMMFGVQAQFGPFFSKNLSFRPSVEFGWGEVTTLVAFNFEGIYRLPISEPTGRWTTYIGAGPGVNLLHQNFERTAGESGSSIDFGDFKSNVGFNVLGGMRYRGGMFFEMKACIYSEPAPTLRMTVGYIF